MKIERMLKPAMAPDKNGLSGDGPQTARTCQTENSCNEMNQKNRKIAHPRIVYGLDRVEVSLGPDEPPAILSADDDPDVSQHWIVQQLLPAPGFIGAVAVEPAL